MTPRFESNSSLSMGSPRVALVPGMSMSHGGWTSGIPTVARKKDNTAGQPGLAWTLELMLSNESKEWQWQNCWNDQVICMMMFIQSFLPWAKWIIFYLDHLEDSQEVLSRKQGHCKGLWLLFKPYQKITALESRSVCPREIFHCINQGLYCICWTIWLGLCICWPMVWDQPNLIIIEISVVLRSSKFLSKPFRNFDCSLTWLKLQVQDRRSVPEVVMSKWTSQPSQREEVSPSAKAPATEDEVQTIHQARHNLLTRVSGSIKVQESWI